MGWATNYIAQLKLGETIQFRPRGNSMIPHINSGDLVTVTPIVESDEIVSGMIVLCAVSGAQYLHFVKAVRGDRYQIGNAHGRINGWTGRKNIYGRVII